MSKEVKDIPESRAVFYSVLWPSMREAALACGWALALHGSMASDMDIMAMPWVEDCKPTEDLIKAISACIGETVWSKDHHLVPHYGKTHGRIVYTLGIGGQFYVDISLMEPRSLRETDS